MRVAMTRSMVMVELTPLSAVPALTQSMAEMAAIIGVDSLAFLSMDGLYRAVGAARRNNELPQYCDACFSGDYPIALTDYKSGISANQKDGFVKEAL